MKHLPESPFLVAAGVILFWSFASVSSASQSWMEHIQTEIAQSEYHASLNPSGLQAPNRVHGIRTYFDANGVEVHDRVQGTRLLRLSLDGVGREGELSLPGAAEVLVEGTRVDLIRPRMIESYINSPEGLEQIFRFESRPAGSGPLILRAAVEDATASVHGESIRFDSGSGRRLAFGALVAIDATGSRIPAHFEAESDESFRIVVDDREALYPLTIDPLLTGFEDALIESAQAGALLGDGVAGAGDVNGDGFADVLVGARMFDGGQADEGAAFLFLGSEQGILSADSSGAYATFEGNEPGAQFGAAVAGADVDGDGCSDLIVSSTNYGVLDEGAVFLFLSAGCDISDGDPSSADATLLSDQGGSAFGFSVASGDFDGDGFFDVVVGASVYSITPAAAEGAAFVYYGGPGGISSPLLPTPIQPSVPDPGSQFGTRVASLEDVNGDGIDDLAVGATTYGANDAGGAFVYYGSAGGVAASPSWEKLFSEPDGWVSHVAGAGDVDGDGFADLIVGGGAVNGSTTNEGAAYIYLGGAGGLASSASSTIESQQAFAALGVAAGAGDVNGDGYADVIVGARGYDVGTGREGAAFIFHGGPSGIVASGTPLNADAVLESDAADVRFGGSVASAGDVNGDGYSDVIVGASEYDSTAGIDAGAAFVYLGGAAGVHSGDASAAAHQIDLTVSGSLLGNSVAGAGDIDGDGFADVIVGARGYDSGFGGGAAFIFHGSASGTSGQPTTAATRLLAQQRDLNFGSVVAGAGDLNGDGYSDVAVSAEGDPDEEVPRGAFLYYGGPGGIPHGSEHTADFEFDSNLAVGAGDVDGDGFGDIASTSGIYYGSPLGIRSRATSGTVLSGASSIAGAGDVNGDGYADVVVGNTSHAGSFGGAFVFHGSPGGISSGDVLNADSQLSGTFPNSRFGNSVASAGDVNGDGYADVIIGAPDHGGSTKGGAFVFHGHADGILDLGSASDADARIETASTSQSLGWVVSGVGDLNGDGFSDVAVAAANAGEVYTYHGSSTGVVSLASPVDANSTLHPNSARISSVSGAGDVDGDGFADLIIGTSSFNVFDGAAYVFRGNQGHAARDIRLLQRRGGSVTVPPWGTTRSESSFQVRMNAKHPAGRDRVKLEVEYCPAGVPFDGPSCLRSQSSAWADATASATGVDLFATIGGLTDDILYRWRARVLHAAFGVVANGVSPPPNPAHGPWRRLTAQTNIADIRADFDFDNDGIDDLLDDDDDGDGLNDLVETATNVFVSAADTGTHPLVVDSDGDGLSDGEEVSYGADPNDPNDPFPTDPVPVDNQGTQISDVAKYRWIGESSYEFEFVPLTDLFVGPGFCSADYPLDCDILGRPPGCFDILFDFLPDPPASGIACCKWQSRFELTAGPFVNSCTGGEVCPPKAEDTPGCDPVSDPNAYCVKDLTCNDSGPNNVDPDECDAEEQRLIGLDVPNCCFERTGVAVFPWNATPAFTESDPFPDQCDNCPEVENDDQADADGDLRGDACDAFASSPYQCSDTDGDGCDDCSSGTYDPSNDTEPCLDPLPEPGGLPGLAAGAWLLFAMAVRRESGRSRSGPRA